MEVSTTTILLTVLSAFLFRVFWLWDKRTRKQIEWLDMKLDEVNGEETPGVDVQVSRSTRR